jgi:hypothetical protein
VRGGKRTALTVSVATGRELEVLSLGPEDGATIFFRHGSFYGDIHDGPHGLTSLRQ